MSFSAFLTSNPLVHSSKRSSEVPGLASSRATLSLLFSPPLKPTLAVPPASKGSEPPILVSLQVSSPNLEMRSSTS